jgi:hypothetical protein
VDGDLLHLIADRLLGLGAAIVGLKLGDRGLYLRTSADSVVSPGAASCDGLAESVIETSDSVLHMPCCTSGGHTIDRPEQVSATSQALAAGRQTVVLGASASMGQLFVLPVQNSGASQSPIAGRQSVVAGLAVSGGQAAAVPEQNSAASQTPTAVRHSLVVGAKSSVGQAAAVPVQDSATSHTPALGRQTVPAGFTSSGGQFLKNAKPEHTSA